jgi:hypothetical protein
MNTLTCADVESQIGLYAADECDPPTRSAIAGHLEQCETCSGSLEQTRHLLGLLDLHANFPAQLERLQARLRGEDRPAVVRLRFRAFAHRAAALAALLLITFGLSLGMPWAPSGGSEPIEGVELALVDTATKPPRGAKADTNPSRGGKAERAQGMLDHAKARSTDLTAPMKAFLKAVEEHRSVTREEVELPKVELTVRLRNDGPGPLYVAVGGKRFDFWVQVRGPGVVNVPAPATEGPFAKERRVTVPAGKEEELKLERLESRIGERRWFTILTKPGKYRVVAHVRAFASRSPAMKGGQPIFLTSPTVTRTIKAR